MSAAYQQIEQQEAAFSQARTKYSALERYMGSEDAVRMTHGELEAYAVERTREIARDYCSGKLDPRGGDLRVVSSRRRRSSSGGTSDGRRTTG